MNVKVNLIFYFIILILTFFSRKVFLALLGANFVGFTTTVKDLLGFLNLAELGIGSAIGYVLYKPLFDQDHDKINEIISVFGYLYRLIGGIILAGGVVLSLFLPRIFNSGEFPLGVIYLCFYSFLASSLIGYFINYRQTLLGADQRNYVVTAYFQSANIVKILAQIALAKLYASYYLWIIVDFIFAIIHSIVLNWKINKVYPWLQSDVKLGHKLFKKYPEVIKYTKQLFVHKIASFAQFQTTPFILYSFTSLTTVAYYTNYSLLANQLYQFANKFLGSTEAGIGNLVAENDKGKIFNVYQEITSLRFFIAGIEAYGLYLLTESFISIWLGPEYVMNKTVLVLVITNFFILQIRGTNDQFIYAYGLFWDVWAPIAEACLSVACAVLLGFCWGLEGVLSGMLVGLILIVCLWKPYFLFHYGMKLSIWKYWRIIFMNVLSIGIAIAVSYTISSYTMPPVIDSIWKWILTAVVQMSIFTFISILCFFSLTRGTRLILKRFFGKWIKYL